MFNPRELAEDGHGGPHAGAAVLTNPQPFRTGIRPDPADFLTRLRHRRDALLHTLASQDWAIDLAEDIGSARWFHGLGTLVGLGALALMLWPEESVIHAAPAVAIDDAARDEFRSQMIQPLALGGDSGRRMGATAMVTPLAAMPERTSVQLTATLGQGDSFVRMLERAGVGSVDAALAMQMVSGVVEPGSTASLS